MVSSCLCIVGVDLSVDVAMNNEQSNWSLPLLHSTPFFVCAYLICMTDSTMVDSHCEKTSTTFFSLHGNRISK